MDLSSVFGTLLGVLALFLGQLLIGGQSGQILQGTAAFIVFGGTLAAVLLAYPGAEILRAFRLIPSIYRTVNSDLTGLIAEIARLAAIARKEGLLAVESQRASLTDPLLKKAVKYVIDGFDPNTVREIIDSEIRISFEEEENAGKLFEGAGAIAPTIGIVGAVLGLIHVMTMLNDPSKIGAGMATAFVAALYGIGLANLVLLPWGTKLKRHASQRVLAKELIKLGVVGIQEGLNPHFLQEKLEVFVRGGRSEQNGRKNRG